MAGRAGKDDAAMLEKGQKSRNDPLMGQYLYELAPTFAEAYVCSELEGIVLFGILASWPVLLA